VFLYLQTPFDAAKQLVIMGRTLLSFAGVGYKGARFVECIHLAVIAIFPALFLNNSSCSQSAFSYTGKCHSTREVTQHRALQICFLA